MHSSKIILMILSNTYLNHPFLLFHRGEVTASVKRIVMTMSVKQKLPANESHPKLTGKLR